jgi:hypothetical protein
MDHKAYKGEVQIGVRSLPLLRSRVILIDHIICRPHILGKFSKCLRRWYLNLRFHMGSLTSCKMGFLFWTNFGVLVFWGEKKF